MASSTTQQRRLIEGNIRSLEESVRFYEKHDRDVAAARARTLLEADRAKLKGLK
jgi:hypothetical protein